MKTGSEIIFCIYILCLMPCPSFCQKNDLYEGIDGLNYIYFDTKDLKDLHIENVYATCTRLPLFGPPLGDTVWQYHLSIDRLGTPLTDTTKTYGEYLAGNIVREYNVTGKKMMIKESRAYYNKPEICSSIIYHYTYQEKKVVSAKCTYTPVDSIVTIYFDTFIYQNEKLFRTITTWYGHNKNDRMTTISEHLYDSFASIKDDLTKINDSPTRFHPPCDFAYPSTKKTIFIYDKLGSITSVQECQDLKMEKCRTVYSHDPYRIFYADDIVEFMRSTGSKEEAFNMNLNFKNLKMSINEEGSINRKIVYKNTRLPQQIIIIDSSNIYMYTFLYK